MSVPLNLKDIQSGFLSASTFNSNNTLIEEALAKALNRTSNAAGNAMEVDLDMGLNYILNLPDAEENHQAVPLRQLQNYIANASSGLVARLRETRKIATEGQTVFNLSDISYTPGVNNLQVYVNGVAQVAGIDYQETDSTTITFLSALNAGDAVDIYANDPVSTPDAALAANLASTTAGEGSDLIAYTGTGETVTEALDNRVIRVSSRTEMKAYDVPAGYQFSLEEGGRSGLFVVKSGTPPSDPQEGIYIVLDNGNYAERINKYPATPEMFGATGIGDDTDAVNGMFALNPGAILVEKDYSVTDISVPSGTTFYGRGSFNGGALGAKPSSSALRSTDASGRLSLLTTYTPSSLAFTGSGSLKGNITFKNFRVSHEQNNLFVEGTAYFLTCSAFGVGIVANRSGRVFCEGIISSDSADNGLNPRNGGQIFADSGIVVSAAKRGLYVQRGSTLSFTDGGVYDSAEEGALLTIGSNLFANRAEIVGNSGPGLSAIYGSNVDFVDGVCSDNGGSGITSESNSSINAENAVVTNNGFSGTFGYGVGTSYSGFVQARNATITGNAGEAVNALTGGQILVTGATIDKTNNSGGIQVNANLNSFVILDEPGSGALSALSNDDCSPTYNTIGKAFAFIGRDEPFGAETIGISFNRRLTGTQSTIATISSGSITATAGWLLIDTEGGASSDDLETIVRSDQFPADEIFIHPNVNGNAVVVKHNVGNIRTIDGSDIIATFKNDVVRLVWNKSTANWIASKG